MIFSREWAPEQSSEEFVGSTFILLDCPTILFASHALCFGLGGWVVGGVVDASSEKLALCNMSLPLSLVLCPWAPLPIV